MVDPNPPTSSSVDTVAAMAHRSRREFVPLRSSFVQRHRSADGEAAGRVGPLADFVTRGDDRALTAYLLVLTPASKEPWTVTFDSRIWARALGIQVDRPAAAISKVWRRLEERRLITRSRSGRLTVVTPLREDGSGEVYTRPDGKKRADHYLKLDHRFWTDDWYRRLSLAGKAVLLIGLSSTPKFELPYERAPKWYGISADTVERGFKELLGHELISYTTTFRAEPLSPTGSVEVRQWSLKGPFIRSAR